MTAILSRPPRLVADQAADPVSRDHALSSPPVVVIGGGLGGLSAAIHLRLQGRPVLLLEANDTLGGRANRIRRNGFTWDTGPTLLNYPWVFRELFAAAGRSFDEAVELIPVDPSVAFQWPDQRRLQLSRDFVSLLAAVREFEPEADIALPAWLADGERKYRLSFDKLVTRNAEGLLDWIRPLTLREAFTTGVWRSLDRELTRFFRSRHLREALGSYAMYLGGSPFDLPGIFSILPYGELSRGLWLPRGGIHAVVEAMAALARDLGVGIRTGTPVSRIDVRKGAARGVFLANDTWVAASVVVSNVDVPTTDTALLGHAPAGARGVERAGRARMTPGVITYYWGIRGTLGGTGLGHHTIFLPDDYKGAFADLMTRGRIPTDLPFYVAQPSATDPGLAPPGDTTLFVLVPTPTLPDLGPIDWDDTVRRQKQVVLERLAHHGVSLTPDRIVEEEVWTPVDWERRFGLYQGSAFGAAHTLRQIGPFRAPNRSPDIRGLYYVGASTTPGTGMPMVVLGGRMTAERIARDVPVHARLG